MAADLRETPLTALHRELGAKLVPFAGFRMPVQYASISAEHQAVRQRAGLFDISHMGEFHVSGPGATAFLDRMTVNDVPGLALHQAHYSCLCRPDGGILDDVVLYRLEDGYLVVVNAANVEKDWTWLTGHAPADVVLEDRSAQTALLALQGPRAAEILAPLASVDVMAIRYYWKADGAVAGVPALISRTGYTGEDGFELYLPADGAARVWSALLAGGAKQGLLPAGLGARDTLRLEMKYALYGNDIDETTNPFEAGLGWVVKPAKGAFVGRDAIERVREGGLRRRLVGFEMVERAVARHGYPILHDGAAVGVVTSGSYGPTVDKYIGIGYVPATLAPVGSAILVEVRGRGQAARVVKTPFHPPRVKR